MRFFIVAVLLALLMGTVATSSAHAASAPPASAAAQGFVPPTIRQLVAQLARRSPRPIKTVVEQSLELVKEDVENDLQDQQRALQRLRLVVVNVYCTQWRRYFRGDRALWLAATSKNAQANYAWHTCTRYRLLRSTSGHAARTVDRPNGGWGQAWKLLWKLADHAPAFIDLILDRKSDNKPRTQLTQQQVINWYCTAWWNFYGGNERTWARATWSNQSARYAWHYCLANWRL